MVTRQQLYRCARAPLLLCIGFIWGKKVKKLLLIFTADVTYMYLRIQTDKNHLVDTVVNEIIWLYSAAYMLPPQKPNHLVDYCCPLETKSSLLSCH
jgi:hypothetical protein